MTSNVLRSPPWLGWPLRNICVTNDHGYVPLVLNISRPFPHAWLITKSVTKLTRRVSLVEQELSTFLEHNSSPSVSSGGSSYLIFSFMCLFCRSFFVLLYVFFWPLCCLFFIDLRILITPLVSSNYSHWWHSEVCFLLWPSPCNRQQRKIKNKTVRQTLWLPFYQ
jgi:hypothetical protein